MAARAEDGWLMAEPRQQGDLERRTGVALWRQIADRIRTEFVAPPGASGARLLPETELASLFAVNRHTVRAAIAALVGEGVLRSEQGRGTFIVKRARLAYPIARRTRFSQGLEGQARDRRIRLVESVAEPASAEIAAALEIAPGTMVLRLEAIGEADAVAVSRVTSWFEAGRFAGLAAAFEKTGSITAALARFGIIDYVRRSTAIEARHASTQDIADLGLAAGAVVLLTRAINTDTQGRPLQFSLTRFAADRVTLQVDYRDAPENPPALPYPAANAKYREDAHD